uniref:Uncharacterized protein n=1 Tax=Romanomermis culicivorax TaxID=13658 RepID=A0A915J411_ROMCU
SCISPTPILQKTSRKNEKRIYSNRQTSLENNLNDVDQMEKEEDAAASGLKKSTRRALKWNFLSQIKKKM